MPQAWTLAIELVLSLLLPCAVWLSGRAAGWFVLVITGVAIAGGLSPFAFHFVLGMLTARFVLYSRKWNPSRFLRGPLWLLAFVLYSFRYLCPSVASLHKGNTDWYLPGIGAALLIVLLCNSGRVQKVLTLPLLRHLGRVSFSVYLNHFLILFVLTPRVMNVISRLFPLKLTWLCGLLFTITFSWLMAALMYRVLEVPSIQLGRWVSGRLGEAKVTTA